MCFISGESESRIRALFQDAAAAAPCIIFIGRCACGHDGILCFVFTILSLLLISTLSCEALVVGEIESTPFFAYLRSYYNNLMLLLDEIDAIAQKREHAQREMERRIVAQMLTCLDDLSAQTTPEET